MGCINPAFLVETIVSIKTPNLYDSLCVPVHLILHRASASDKMFVCVHDFSINVQSWVLFLGLLNHFIEHVVEKEISFSVEQEDKIIRKVPAGVDTFQCLYYSWLPVEIHFNDQCRIVFEVHITVGEGCRWSSLHVLANATYRYGIWNRLNFLLELAAQKQTGISEHYINRSSNHSIAISTPNTKCKTRELFWMLNILTATEFLSISILS